MDKKEMIALAERIQRRIQKQLPDFRFITKTDEIEKEFKEWEKLNDDKYILN